MAPKKRSKIEAMTRLKKQIGDDLFFSLSIGSAVLIRDSNEDFPFQSINYVDLEKVFRDFLEIEERLYDSREKEPLSYECFEPSKKNFEKKGMQNFYELNLTYYRAYSKNFKKMNL